MTVPYPVSYPWAEESAADRIAAVQQRVKSSDPATQSVFTQLFHGAKTATAGADSAVFASPASGLQGALVSVKDLFDVNGYVTRAGTRFMQRNAPANEDAAVVSALRCAGAVMVGHTGMTELAYSGLGINPHYGTPDNALYPGCIPGGSTAGGAVSVAIGLADIALGTDTGGSLRIPAAFNGIVGYKPTQRSVSRRGCRALSVSLDSAGVMAENAAICELAYHCIRSAEIQPDTALTPEFVIPVNYGMDDLEPNVQALFDQAVTRLRNAGFTVVRDTLASLAALNTLPVWQFAAVESRAEYAEAYNAAPELIDPAVLSRMSRADDVSAVVYRQTINQRSQLIDAFAQELNGRVLLMPTVPILPPAFDRLKKPVDYNRINLQVLRNTSIANVMDGCSISLPISDGRHTTGLMMTAKALSDDALLSLAVACEEHLA